MNKHLLLSLAALCAVPALNAQVPAAAPLKGHVVNGNASTMKRAKSVRNLNPRLEADGNSASLWESFETDGGHDFINGWTTQLTNENDWYVGTPILSGVTPP